MYSWFQIFDFLLFGTEEAKGHYLKSNVFWLTLLPHLQKLCRGDPLMPELHCSGSLMLSLSTEKMNGQEETHVLLTEGPA